MICRNVLKPWKKSIGVSARSYLHVGNGPKGWPLGDPFTTLPAFGFSGVYAFTEKWVGRAGIGLFAFSLALSDEKDLSGEIVNAEISIHHNTFENVQFGLKYSYFDVRVEFENSDRINALN
jgi:hypothetical protein